MAEVSIKKFTKEDYPLLRTWWDAHGETPPEVEFMPDTSYILYVDNQPILSVSLILTNTPICWIDNYIGNPQYKGPMRQECGSLLLSHLEEVAKYFGKTRLFCMSMKEKVSRRYIQLGFEKTADNISTFIKGVN